MKTAARAAVLSASLLPASSLAAQWEPPAVAFSLESFETAYPKTSASAALLGLETLSAALGIDVSPPNDSDRPHPTPDAVKAWQSSSGAVSSWVRRELEQPGERVGAPPPAVVEYIDANAATLDKMVSLLASGQEIVWDLDVALGANASIPNLLGLSFLQRFLASRGLLDVRRGNSDDGLVVVEAMWRICEALAARPEVIAPLVALNQARYAEGVLRKIPAPAYGWSERLREQKLYPALLVALQNAPWAAAKNSESVGDAAIFARIHRRFVEGLVAASACEWSRGALTHEFEVAAGAEEDPERAIATMFSTSIVDIATRSFRFLLDSEFTAMVVEGRIDRFVARDGQWPDKLSHLESAVCPGRFYTYRKGNGAFLEFPPPAPKDDSPNLNLPLTFRGAPPPTPTPTSRPPVLTPTPSAHRLLKR